MESSTSDAAPFRSAKVGVTGFGTGADAAGGAGGAGREGEIAHLACASAANDRFCAALVSTTACSANTCKYEMCLRADAAITPAIATVNANSSRATPATSRGQYRQAGACTDAFFLYKDLKKYLWYIGT